MSEQTAYVVVALVAAIFAILAVCGGDDPEGDEP